MAMAKENANDIPLDKLSSTISFVWLDRDNNEHFIFKKTYGHKLGIKNESWLNFEDKESLIQFLKSLNYPKQIILISSGGLTKEIIADIQDMKILHSVYIFCENVSKYLPLAEKYSKIVAVESDRERIYEKLRANLEVFQQTKAVREAQVPPTHSRRISNNDDNNNSNVEFFGQPPTHWCPWNSKTCSNKLPLPGQGTVEIMLEKSMPFELRLSNKENPTDPNAYVISLSVDATETRLTVNNKARDSSQIIHHILHKDDGKWHTYWLSIFKDPWFIKYGIGEVREAFTIFNVTIPENEQNLLKQVGYLHVRINNNDNMLMELDKYKENFRFFLGKEPVIRDPAMFIIPQDKYSIETTSAIPPSKLEKPCRDLYDSVINFRLNTDDFPDFIQAIERSVRNPAGWCYKKLEEKANRFGRPNPMATYLRITYGQKLGTAPGHAYVIEIWPPGHYSPIHNHSNAYGIIRVLYGRLLAKVYPELTTKPFQYAPIEQILEEDQVTWMLPKLNQTHQVRNPDLYGPTAISIQCYQYGQEDNIHYEYFDYVTNDGLSIAHFDPKSDIDYQDFKALMKQEWHHLKNA